MMRAMNELAMLTGDASRVGVGGIAIAAALKSWLSV